MSLSAVSQSNVTGKVIDAESKEPLQGASVFGQNTTVGTVSNKEGHFSLELKPGGYDLIITYTGYQTQTIRINTADNSVLEVAMVKQDNSMGEVVIRSSAEVADGWEKYGAFFSDHFIGSTPFAKSCTLINPTALKFYFYKRTNRLKILATEPLQIINKALGYNLTYTLDSFVHYYNTGINTYRGYCLFGELEGSTDEQKLWTKNRERAYFGSRLHFMRSYFDSTLLEDGFRIDMLTEDDDSKFAKITDPYDTTWFIPADSINEVEIYFPRKISVTYIKRTPENEYLSQYKLPMNVGVQISYIELLEPVAIKENGYHYDQKAWVNEGYWSWKNLADLLPYDYLPY